MRSPGFDHDRVADVPSLAFRRALGALLLLGAVAACERIIGADFEGQKLQQCRAATPPGPPSIRGAGGSNDFVLATSSIDVGESDLPDGAPAYARIGFSLDGLCTRPTGACSPPSWTGSQAMKGLDGRDNGIGILMHGQMSTFGQVVFRSETLTKNIRSGTNSPLMIMRISGYNGFANDDEVVVEVFVPSPADPAKPFVPKWEGNDAWPLSPLPDSPRRDAVDGGDAGDAGDGGGAGLTAANFVDKHAYVNEYTLTAHLPAGTEMTLANVVFRLDEFIVSGKMDPVGQTLMHGTLAGRLVMAELFRKLPEVTQILVDQALCTDNANYPMVKSFFCSYPDIRTAPGTGDCDTLSFGVGFETAHVRLGPVVDPPRVFVCPTESSPEKDSCKNR